jgi:hypothetical protein
MGTFHSDKGELHGITVVVRTRGKTVFVGRCDTVTPDAVYLLDADKHEDGAEGKSIDEYLKAAAQWGHWPRIPAIEVPATEVESIQRMSELREA